jgi:hypothetical protein
VSKPELRRELLDLFDADQAERTGEAVGSVNHDRTRTERLKEIIDDFGWPTWSMVGKKGGTAAWAIAQHSDQDLEFQEQALELLRKAVEDEEADPTELAYLVDRVATHRGEPQTYGTQVGCIDGHAVAGEIEDEANVDQRRSEVGLGPLQDYLGEMNESCAQESLDDLGYDDGG